MTRSLKNKSSFKSWKIVCVEILEFVTIFTEICYWVPSVLINGLYNHGRIAYSHLTYNIYVVKSQKLYSVGTLFKNACFQGCSVNVGKLGCLLMRVLPFCMNEYIFWWAHFFWYASKQVLICGHFISWSNRNFSLLGPNIWLEYGQYSVGGIGQKGGLEKVRSVFERALSSVGLHMTKGLAIWEAYREFESAIVEAARVSSVPWPVLAFE